jgi:hypothetical protein
LSATKAAAPTLPGTVVAEDPDGRFVVVETVPVAGTKSEKKPFLIMDPGGARLARAATLEAAMSKGDELLSRAS